MDRQNALVLALICLILASVGGQSPAASPTLLPPSTVTTPTASPPSTVTTPTASPPSTVTTPVKPPVSAPVSAPVATPPTVSVPPPVKAPVSSPPAPVPVSAPSPVIESPPVSEPTAAPVEAPIADVPAPAPKKAKGKKHSAPSPAPSPDMMAPNLAPGPSDAFSPGPSDAIANDLNLQTKKWSLWILLVRRKKMLPCLKMTMPQIKAEMEKTLQWLVPVATDTTKAHQGFGWVGEWANTSNEFGKKTAGSNNIIRLQTLYHADKQKMDRYILDLIIWLHRLISLVRFRDKVPSRLKVNGKLQRIQISLEDKNLLEKVMKRRMLVPGISKSQEFVIVKKKKASVFASSRSMGSSPRREPG